MKNAILSFSGPLLLLTILGASRAADLAPASVAGLTGPFPQFSWPAHPAAFKDPGAPVCYEVELAKDAAFTMPVDKDSIYLNRYVPDQPLESGTYFWRARASRNGKVLTDWTATSAFTVAGCERVVRVPDAKDLVDVGEAVLAAVSQARQLAADGNPVKLAFARGDYHIGRQHTRALLNFDQDRNILVEGNGACIHFASRTQCLLQANRSTNLVVRNLNVRFLSSVTALQGWVKALDLKANRATVWFPHTNLDYSSEEIRRGSTVITLMDPRVDGRLKAGAVNFFRTKGDYHKNPDGTWSFTVVGKLSDWAVGDRFVQQQRAGAQSLVRLQDCTSVTLYGVTSSGAPGMHFTAFGGCGLNLLHCRILREDGAWYGGGADGVHCRGMTVGPWIEGCSFEALGDDGIALYARPATLCQLHPGGNPNAVVCREEFFNLEPGDEVAFFQPQDGAILLETVVQQVTPSEAGRHTVVFAAPVPDGLRTDGSILEATQIWNRSKSSGDFLIRSNRFENIRRYGTVFRARRGVVENNTYMGTSSRAILFFNETQYPNGLYASDIIIRKNDIEGSGFDSNGLAAPVAMNFVGQHGPAKSFGPRGILIEDNVFKHTPSPEILLVSSRDVTVRHNQVESGAGHRVPARVTQRNTKGVSVE